jgi:hypothetical protein
MSRFSKGNFVGLHRGAEADFLQRNHPAAFLLLCLISRRARYTEEPCLVTGLRFGESLIGDWKEAGLTSEKSYRCAKTRLEKGRLCAFRRASTGARRGTIATLLPQGIFSISYTAGAGDGAGKGQGKGRQGAGKGRQTTKEPFNDETKEPSTPPKSPKGDLVEDLPHQSEKFRSAWKGWEKHRTELRKKLTPTTRLKQLTALSELTEAKAIETIERSIAAGWTGLFEDKSKSSRPSENQPQPTVADLMNGKPSNIINASELNLEESTDHE